MATIIQFGDRSRRIVAAKRRAERQERRITPLGRRVMLLETLSVRLGHVIGELVEDMLVELEGSRSGGAV